MNDLYRCLHMTQTAAKDFFEPTAAIIAASSVVD